MSTATTVAADWLTVDDDGGAVERGERRDIRLAHLAIPHHGGPRRVAAIVGLAAQRVDHHPPAGGAQRGRRDEAVTAVVAGSAQHVRLAGAAPARDDRLGHCDAGAAHRLEARQPARERRLLGGAHLRSGQQRQVGMIGKRHRSAHLAGMRKAAS
jgi:hypothetical protein